MENVLLEKKMNARSHTGGPGTKSILLLAGALAVAKVATFLPLFLLSHVSLVSFLYKLGTEWDSGFYDKIAQLGYNGASKPGSDNAYAFSPVLPSMISAVKPITGSYWSAGLIIVNAFSFLFPIVVLKISNFRTALIAELFPVYLVFSTLNYADVITLFFLALSLYFLLRRRMYFFTGVFLALALLTSYAVILTVPIFAAKIIFDKRQSVSRNTASKVKDLGRFVLPIVVVGLGIAAFFLVKTGSLWTFFRVEKNAGWDVTFVTPIQQVQFLLSGWFTGFKWRILGFLIPRIWWALRNIAFEAFYVAGVVLLLIKRSHLPDKLFLSGMALAVMIPLYFVGGVAAASVPRLLLPAFPVLFGYSAGLLRGRKSIVLYGGLCLVIAASIALWQVDALFG